MLIGMVIDTSGLVPKQDSIVFDSLGRKINVLFGTAVATVRNSSKKIIEVNLNAAQRVNQLVIQEDIAKGENIRNYSIEAWVDNHWKQVADGQSVGHKRIQTFTPLITKKIRLVIEKAEGPISIKYLGFYNTNL